MIPLSYPWVKKKGLKTAPPHIDTPSPTAEPLPSSPTSPETLFEKCAFISCFNPATQFFSSTKIHNTRYKDLLICHPCTRFIPLKELRANPAVLFPWFRSRETQHSKIEACFYVIVWLLVSILYSMWLICNTVAKWQILYYCCLPCRKSLQWWHLNNKWDR